MIQNLQTSDFASLSPLLILLFTALSLLLLESLAEDKAKKYAFFLTLVGIIIAMISTSYSPKSEHPLLTPWLKFDQISKFFTLFFLAIGLASTLLAPQLFQRFKVTQGEYFFLLISAIFGLILIGSSADFLTLFLGVEILSISLYVLCCYMKKWKISHEAAIKYFLMGSLASAFLLYGIALVYGATGTTQFDALMPAYKSFNSGYQQSLFLSGIALITLGLAFEAAIIPFHLWAPDVYEGASTPVTAFMAAGTKAGAFAAFIRVFMVSLPNFDVVWNNGIALLAYPTLIYANIVALKQTQLRRFFAYSSISHAGFMLIPIAAATEDAIPALIFYLIVYVTATLGAFAVLSILDDKIEGISFNDLKGLFYRAPFLGVLLALSLLTLAGIPPTAGFFAKFYIFKVAFESGYVMLVVTGLLTTILSAFYYLRIIALMLSQAPVVSLEPPHSIPATVLGAASFAVLFVLSWYPAPLITLIALASKI